MSEVKIYEISKSELVNLNEDDYWEEHSNNYEKFINDNKNKKVLFLELGAGFNTPGIIRYPFEDLTYKLPNAFLIRINDKYASVPNDIEDKAIGIQDDINNIINEISKLRK